MIFHGHTGSPTAVRPSVRPSVRRPCTSRCWLADCFLAPTCRAPSLWKLKNYKFACSFNVENLKIFFWKPLMNLAIFLDIMLCQSWRIKAKISQVWISSLARCLCKNFLKDEGRTRREHVQTGRLFIWIRSYKKTEDSWVTEDSSFREDTLSRAAKISLKSEIKNLLHWAWNRVGPC